MMDIGLLTEEPRLGAGYCATSIAVWGNNKTKARTGELALHVWCRRRHVHRDRYPRAK